MADFPLLDSGAKAQYPLRRTIRFETHVTRFVDGTEQRFRQHGGGEMEWDLRLSGLSSGEARRLSGFVDEQMGAQGEFTFQDPMGGTVSGCHLSEDALRVAQTDEEKNDLRVKIRSKV